MGLDEFYKKLLGDRRVPVAHLSRRDVLGGIAQVLSKELECTRIEARILVEVYYSQQKTDTRIFPCEEFEVKDGWVRGGALLGKVSGADKRCIANLLDRRFIIENPVSKGWYRSNNEYNSLIVKAVSEYEKLAV